MQDGPEDRTRRSRRTRAAEDRPAVDDPLFGPLPGEDKVATPTGGPGQPVQDGPADRSGATADDLRDGYGAPGAPPPGGRESGSREPGSREPGSREPGSREPGSREPGGAAHRTGNQPPRRRAATPSPRAQNTGGPETRTPPHVDVPGDPTGGRRRADRPVADVARDAPGTGATGGAPPGTGAARPGTALGASGERPREARAARPRSAERTDALPPVTPRGTPRPAGEEPSGRRRRSPADMRATEVISTILPRRRRAADDASRDTPQDTPAPPPGEPSTDAVGQVAPAPNEPPGTGHEDGRAGPRDGRVLRIAAAALAALVVVATAAGFTSRNRVDDGIVAVPALDPTSDAISSVAAQAGDENVLVLGLAADRLREPEAARTDTAVLVHVPEGGGPSVTLSLPATLEVPRPPCQRWDPASSTYGPTVPAESRTTLSSVFDVGGPRCSVGAVQQLTGLAVTRFVALDLAGVAGLVDAVRGVTVCTERPVIDQALGPIVAVAGDTELGGGESVRFAGAAAVVDDTSPANRIQRQQRVLAAALDRALSTSALLTPGTPSRVARALSGSVLADGADAAEVLTVARSLSRVGTAGDGSTPVFLPVPITEAPNTRGHLELHRGDASDLFEAMRKHEPLPESVTAPAQRAAAAILPEGAEIDVLNAAGRAGLAGQVADSLRAQGFRVRSVSDAPEAPVTVVRFSPDRAELAAKLTASLPSAVAAPDPTASATLQLLLGSGFSGPVTVPTQPPAELADCG